MELILFCVKINPLPSFLYLIFPFSWFRFNPIFMEKKGANLLKKKKKSGSKPLCNRF